MESTKLDVRVFSDPDALNQAAAEEITRTAEQSVREKGCFHAVLSGGSTPRGLYTLLADKNAPYRDRFPWDKTHFFFSDERDVLGDHPDSNYRMARESLLKKVPVPGDHMHPIPAGTGAAGAAARIYEERLNTLFRLKPREMPRFDFVLLGMGADGHTASWFPGSDVLLETERLVSACWVEKLKAYRVTLTPPVINNAARVVFLVMGEEKAAALRAALQGEGRPQEYPVRAVRPREGKPLWLVDKAAYTLIG